MSVMYPIVTDASFNHTVTIGSGQWINNVAFQDCAEPGPAQDLANYLNEAHPDIKVTVVDQWPLYNQDVQGNNPFKQSQKVPAYIIHDLQGNQLDDILAGNLLRYAQQFQQGFFDHLIEMWYGPGGTQEQALQNQ